MMIVHSRWLIVKTVINNMKKKKYAREISLSIYLYIYKIRLSWLYK